VHVYSLDANGVPCRDKYELKSIDTLMNETANHLFFPFPEEDRYPCIPLLDICGESLLRIPFQGGKEVQIVWVQLGRGVYKPQLVTKEDLEKESPGERLVIRKPGRLPELYDLAKHGFLQDHLFRMKVEGQTRNKILCSCVEKKDLSNRGVADIEGLLEFEENEDPFFGYFSSYRDFASMVENRVRPPGTTPYYWAYRKESRLRGNGDGGNEPKFFWKRSDITDETKFDHAFDKQDFVVIVFMRDKRA
jgi:hypothetical protein